MPCGCFAQDYWDQRGHLKLYNINDHPDCKPWVNAAPMCKVDKAAFTAGTVGFECCSGSEITSKEECLVAAASLGITNLMEDHTSTPCGCSFTHSQASEVWWNDSSGCADSYPGMAPICRENSGGNSLCANTQYLKLPRGSNSCPSGHRITDMSECSVAGKQLGFPTYNMVLDNDILQCGCVGELYYFTLNNRDSNCGNPHWGEPLCKYMPTDFVSFDAGTSCPSGGIMSVEECHIAASMMGHHANGNYAVSNGDKRCGCSIRVDNGVHVYEYTRASNCVGQKSTWVPVCRAST